jgi:hypothetical protein
MLSSSNALLSNWGETLICRGLKRRKLVEFSESDTRALKALGHQSKIACLKLRP